MSVARLSSIAGHDPLLIRGMPGKNRDGSSSAHQAEKKLSELDKFLAIRFSRLV